MPAQWRMVRSAPATGARNMAVDATLLEAARRRAFGVWRPDAWATPTVSFGRHEAVRGRFDADTLARAGLDAVRRPTGGRALLHAAEVTYSVALPVADNIPWRSVYQAVNAVVLEALHSLDVNASLVPEEGAPLLRPEGPVCFDQPAPGEIVVLHAGVRAKLVGSAVWRDRGAYLQHGSILLQDEQGRLSEATIGHVTTPPPAASLATCLAVTPSWDAVATALEQALAASVARAPALAEECIAVPEDDLLDPDAIAQHDARFCDPRWLWRR